MPDPSQELPQGLTLGDYTIERSLGQGGFGITYLATDNTQRTKVVIKENLPAAFAYREAGTNKVFSRRGEENEETFAWAVENFMNEAKTIATLNHPNIVKVLRAFKALGTAYYVMPYINGVSLEDYRKEHDAPPERQLRKILLLLLDALAYLHRRNLLHRDIKPANILLTSTGQLQLIDFGTVRQLTSEKTQTVIESAGYTPLEQTQSHGHTGPWTDLYALGGTMYKLVTGVAPPKNADRVGSRDPLKRLAEMPELKRRYTLTFLESVDKALAVNPEDRWQDASEWARALGVRHLPSACDDPQPIDAPPGYTKDEILRIQQRAELGDPEAQYELAELYAQGKDIEQDGSKAAMWLWEAAEQGHAEAQYQLGVSYANSDNAPQDDDEAARWCRKAAVQGHESAAGVLCVLAEAGNATAQFNLAECFAHGWSVAQDDVEADRWYHEAEEKEHKGTTLQIPKAAIIFIALSLVFLAAAFYQKPIWAWERLANWGHPAAQYKLGKCYEEGNGVEQNENEAAEWYGKAARKGYVAAKEALLKLAAQGNGTARERLRELED